MRKVYQIVALSSVDNLGSFVIWDFVANRKKKG